MKNAVFQASKTGLQPLLTNNENNEFMIKANFTYTEGL